MPEYKTMFVRQRKYIFFLLSFFVLGWGFTTYQSIFLGLIVGTALSLFNLWLIVKRIDKFGEAIKTGRSVRSLGTVSRMATAVLAVMIALKYPEQVHFISVIIGLMASYIVIMIDYFFQLIFVHK